MPELVKKRRREDMSLIILRRLADATPGMGSKRIVDGDWVNTSQEQLVGYFKQTEVQKRAWVLSGPRTDLD